IRYIQEGRDEDALDEREEERVDQVLRKLARRTLRHDQRREQAQEHDDRVLRHSTHHRRLGQRKGRPEYGDDDAGKDQPVCPPDERGALCTGPNLNSWRVREAHKRPDSAGEKGLSNIQRPCRTVPVTAGRVRRTTTRAYLRDAP